jgi:hypothetical protein
MIKRSLVFVAMLLCVAFSVQAQEITTAVGNGADTYLSNDSQVREGYDFTADGTHGGEPTIKMRNLEGTRLKLGYVRFDISQLSGAQDISLALNVVWFKGVNSTFHIYALVNESLDNWDEMTISYNTAPGFVPTTQGIPIGYYDITEDLVKVAEMAYPDDSLGYIYSTPSAKMDSVINSDTNGLVTFAIIPDPVPDGDWDVATKEDSVIYAPKLVVLESITTAAGSGADTYLSNDSQVREGYDFTADGTHGGEPTIKMRNLEGTRMKLGYVRFDISQLSDAQSVSLALNVVWFKGVSSTFHIYALVNESLDNWDEMTISYNTAPGFVPTTQGIPIGYYDITADLVKVAETAYPDDFLGYIYSTPSAKMDSIINSDTNGLVTFAIIPDPVPDGDWDVATKEDSVVYAPKLVGVKKATAVAKLENGIPSSYNLFQNYPNPFNPVTNIEFNLANSGHTTLEIYNTLGQLVETLVDRQMSRGNHLISFRADKYESGVYFYKLRSGNFTEVKKMMFLK